MNKKLLPLLLAVAMSVSVTLPAFASSKGNTVTSISTSLSGLKVLQGTSATKAAAIAARKAAAAANQASITQIKAIYTTMKQTEAANKVLFQQLGTNEKQVNGFIKQVKEGTLTYTDDQFAQVAALSTTLATDNASLSTIYNTIQADEVAVKADNKAKNFAEVITALTTESADRTARGAAVTVVNTDLTSVLAILTLGQTPVVTPAPVVTPVPVITPIVTPDPIVTPVSVQ